MMITLPWPDSRLTPNFKRANHWSKYRPAEKNSREVGCILTCHAIAKEDRMALAKLERLPMTVRFIPPDKRRRDDDGMIGAFKHLRDGMADAIGIDDRRFAPVYEIGEPQTPGRIEVCINSANHAVAPAKIAIISENRPTKEVVR